jgi:TM2 domain-containing membrane protein YozV
MQPMQPAQPAQPMQPMQPMQPVPYTPPDPAAPYGRDPVTGQPLSDKSKLAAGLLQIFLGQWGIGRFYLGDSQRGLIHIGLWVGGFILAFIYGLGLILILGNLGWALVDGVMILTDKVPDKQGRKLR